MATQIFISYRRDGGDMLARSIYERLDKHGYECFLDKEKLGSGKFNTALYNQIDECTDFLLVLPQNALNRCTNSDDWVRLEIERAIEKQKNIIPIMMPDFEFPLEEDLPKSMQELPYYQSLRLDENFFSEGIQQLEERYLRSKPIKNRNLSTFIKFVPIIIICFIGFFFLQNNQTPPKVMISGNITIGSEDEVTIEEHLKTNPANSMVLGVNDNSNDDTPEKFEDYLKKANNGDAKSMFNVSMCYYWGKGVEQDWNKGFKWCLKSAEANYPDGMLAVAIFYGSGIGVEKNKDNARKWFTEVYEYAMKDSELDLEDYRDMLGMGFFYFIKYCSDIDKKESGENAFKWFKNANDTNSVIISSEGIDSNYAKIFLGSCYIAGIGTAPDYAKAFELFTASAQDYIEFPVYVFKANDPEGGHQENEKFPNENPSKDVAKFFIGYCYAEGKGVAQDYQKAFEYFMQAAEAGVTEAMANVGAYYWQGKGVEQDYDKAFNWCLKAANEGNVTAMNTLGKIYYLDKGSHQNYEKALEWFEKAANAGNIDAMKNLAIMYQNGEGVAKNAKKSQEWQHKYEKFKE